MQRPITVTSKSDLKFEIKIGFLATTFSEDIQIGKIPIRKLDQQGLYFALFDAVNLIYAAAQIIIDTSASRRRFSVIFCLLHLATKANFFSWNDTRQTTLEKFCLNNYIRANRASTKVARKKELIRKLFD